jgi:hypothetical protein
MVELLIMPDFYSLAMLVRGSVAREVQQNHPASGQRSRCPTRRLDKQKFEVVQKKVQKNEKNACQVKFLL